MSPCCGKKSSCPQKERTFKIQNYRTEICEVRRIKLEIISTKILLKDVCMHIIIRHQVGEGFCFLRNNPSTARARLLLLLSLHPYGTQLEENTLLCLHLPPAPRDSPSMPMYLLEDGQSNPLFTGENITTWKPSF